MKPRIPEEFSLPLQTASLRAVVDESGWARWTLLAEGVSVALGGEDIDVVAPRLLDRVVTVVWRDLVSAKQLTEWAASIGAVVCALPD